jgi:NAD(P)-dependent dehydrogenase (short-subunit alcohol dehydrogenase family)
MKFPDRIALVTGAASGIGLATARGFRAGGAHVIALDIDEPGLSRLDGELGGIAGAGGFSTVAVDLADRRSVRREIDAVIAAHGRIDLCVNHAAAVANWGEPTAVDDDTWTRSLDVNLRGLVTVCQAAIPAMPAGSAIVNTSSIAGGLKPSPSRTPYTAAKAAVVAFTRDLAVAYGPRGIRVNSIVPGFIDTPMAHRLMAGHEAVAEAEKGRIPLRRLGEASEVADAALFLASDRASYVNGAVLVVDGGLSLV